MQKADTQIILLGGVLVMALRKKALHERDYFKFQKKLIK
jgi:hypothetical protein